MKTLSLTALALLSTSAFATDARVDAFQGNKGLKDDTDYRTYFSKTDNGRDSMWFDLAAADAGGDAAPVVEGEEAVAAPADVGAQGGILSAAYRADGRSMRLQQNTLGSTDINYYAADGDTGYNVMLRATNKDNVTIGGGYGMTNGNTDMAFGGMFTAGEDSTDVVAYVQSRTLTKTDVSAYGAAVSYVGKNAIIDAEYDMGWRFKSDRSRAAVTLGPRATITKPEEGDMSISTRLAHINIAGEFALNDWFGLRGSVGSGLDATIPMGDEEFDVMSPAVEAAFGASLDFAGADIDFTISPTKVLDGPYFLTGAGAGQPFAASMSARFDI